MTFRQNSFSKLVKLRNIFSGSLRACLELITRIQYSIIEGGSPPLPEKVIYNNITPQCKPHNMMG